MRFFVGVALAGVLLVGWELGWRHRGFVPSVSNSTGLWSVWRARAASGRREVVALLGSSRLQAAVDLDVMQARFPGREFVQLSINSAHLMAMMRDLAEDYGFRGTLIAEVLPADVFTTHEETPSAWVRSYHQRPPLDGVETALRTWFSGHSVSLMPELGMGSVPHWLIEKHRAPPVPYYRLDARRQLRMHFELADLGDVKRFFAESIRQFGSAATEAEMAARTTQIAAWVAAVRARGGDVIFVRMPATKDVRAVEDERFPDARYWTPFQRRFARALSYEDVPALAGFDCPDGTHLDARDAPGFSALFADALRARGWL